MKAKLNDAQRRALVGALYTASQRYRDCERACRNEPGHAPIADQFLKQIEECRELLDIFEE